jgi:acyl-coenzyme A thioesterase PaaI-like protein
LSRSTDNRPREAAEEGAPPAGVKEVSDPKDLEPLDGSLFGPGQPCFGCSPDHPHGLRLKFTREGDEVVTRFVPNDLQQGPPGIMHGGLVMTLADEVAAWAILASRGKFGFTTSFEGKLSRAVRVGKEIEARSRISEDKRRVVAVQVTMRQDGEEVFSGTFRFVLLDRGGAERLLGGPLPEAWLRFTR